MSTGLILSIQLVVGFKSRIKVENFENIQKIF